MKNKLIISLLFIILVMALPVFAGETQQFIKIPLEPSYAESIGDKPTYFLMVMDNFNFTKIMSVMINFNVFVKVDTTFFAVVGGEECRSPKFFAEGGSSRQITFDCSNIIVGKGKYIVTITVDNPVSSVFGWAEVSYMSSSIDVCPAMPDIPACPAVPDVKSSMMIALKDYSSSAPASLHLSGTDYYFGETATVFAQLVDTNGNPVNNASCNFDMYNTTNPLLPPIYNKQPMLFRGADGIYYYQFSTNNLIAGVYPVDAECSYNYDNFYFYSGSMTNFINVTTNSGTFIGGSPLALNSPTDDTYMQWKDVPNVTLTWSNVSGNITQVDFYFLVDTQGARTLSFYAKNKTSGGFRFIGNLVTNGAGLGLPDLFTASISLDYLNATGFVSIRVVQTAGGGSTNIYFDWAKIGRASCRERV